MFRILLTLTLISISFSASADIGPVEKINGQCPGRYSGAGNWCNPTALATKAIPRINGCPLHFSGSGPFCVGWTKYEDATRKKGGACPGGWFASGKWCVKTK